MTQEKSPSLALAPRTLPEINSLAEVLAASSLIPKELKGKVPDVVVQILAGLELGLAPMASIRGIHIIQGKPVLSADAMVGLVLGSGLCEYFTRVEETETSVTYESKRKGSPHAVRATWTDADSKAAGLDRKDNYRLHKKQMRMARAKAILARDLYPDVLAGCYEHDEITVPAQQQMPSRRDAEVTDVEDAVIVSETRVEQSDEPSPVATDLDRLFADYLAGIAQAPTLVELDRVATSPAKPERGTDKHKQATAAYVRRRQELSANGASR